MDQPNPPKEDRNQGSEESGIPGAEKPPRVRPKVVIYRGMPTFRSPEEDKPPASKPGRSPFFRRTARRRAQGAASALEHPTRAALESPPQAESQPIPPITDGGERVPLDNGTIKNPGRRLHEFESAAKNSPPARIPWQYRLRPNRELTHRAYWDVVATFSLIFNALLICVLVVMSGQISNLKSTVNNLLGGLYGNFVKMDQASINTTILVNAEVPLNFNLPVSQNTEVTLTSNVNIPGAHVVINTGGLNINSQANVTLPAGTILPIALNMNIPVQSSIPINLQVPVSIPLNQTDLHEPFTGLQTTIRPLYCLFNKDAQFPEGSYICAEHTASSTDIP
jgi:hypothetical protein